MYLISRYSILSQYYLYKNRYLVFGTSHESQDTIQTMNNIIIMKIFFIPLFFYQNKYYM